MIKIEIVNNFRNNKEIINSSFEIFKNKYYKYNKEVNREVSITEINKIINDTLKSFEFEKNKADILKKFYTMVLDMFITMSKIEIIEKNINILLNNQKG